MNEDLEALHRLMPFIRDAVAQQPTHIADQLDAALNDGRTTLEFIEADGDVFALVSVDGNQLAQVNIRNLVPLEGL